MSETVFKALIINISDFNIYDQIITVLLPSNNKYSLIALGTKKILSKNARHISLLNEVEIEAFLSNDPKKISKLKKLISITSFPWELLTSKVFQNYLSYLNYSTEFKCDFYSLFNYLLELTKMKVDENIIFSVLLKFIFIDLGLSFNFKSCAICKSKYVSIVSIENSSLVCKNCNDFKERIYPLWFLKNFYYFFYNNNKIKFNDKNQEKTFYYWINQILEDLIEKHGGFKCKEK